MKTAEEILDETTHSIFNAMESADALFDKDQIGVILLAMESYAAQSKWISVEMKLPPLDTAVWVWWYPEGDIEGYGTESELWNDGDKVVWGMGSAQNFRVTHWMELPAPPQKGEHMK